MSDRTVETWENDRGTLRVRLEIDTDADQPWGDGMGHVYAIDYGRYDWRADLLHEGKGGAPDLDEALGHWSPSRERETLERYLRVFHDAVSFAWYQRRSGGYLFEVVTADMAREWGNDDPSEWGNLANLSEWEAWDEGAVYGYVVEELVRWDRVTPPRLGSDSARDTWEEVDSCWGFYGSEYAEKSARDALREAEEG